MNSRRNKIPVPSILLGLAVFFIAVVWGSTLLSFAGSFVQTIGRGAWIGGESLGNTLQAAEPFLKTKTSLNERNRALEEEIQMLSRRMLSFEYLVSENRQLKETLGRIDSREYVLAGILARPNKTPYDTLVIDVGENGGLAPLSRVYGEEGILIGEIGSVYGKTAIVNLLSRPDNFFPVVVGQEKIPGEAEGRGNGNFSIRLPSEAPVTLGDFISAPGLSGGIIGVVGFIEKDEAEPFQMVFFKLPFNIQELSWVYVEKK